jgi:hypothetical protein
LIFSNNVPDQKIIDREAIDAQVILNIRISVVVGEVKHRFQPPGNIPARERI